MKMFYFSTPASASVTLTLDSGLLLVGQPDTHPTGRPGVSFEIPATAINGGAARDLTAPDYDPLHERGIVFQTPDGFVYLLVDEGHLNKTKVCPDPVPIPPPHPNATPIEIINAVYATGQFNLATKDGCGQFTEACCTALHNQHSDRWGHIQKIPPQNHYPESPYVPGGKVHAVDAIQLLVAVGDFGAGIYDLIVDSESTNAKPSCNFKGSPDPGLFYYPAK